MRKLGGAISEIIIDEYGRDEYLRRLADPFFFQSLGCVLGFDWHSSGLTTTVCGALKEAVNELNCGVAIAGGKGKASMRTLAEIDELADDAGLNLSTHRVEKLKYASRMAAKVDNSLVQDNYQLYHHSFIVSKHAWAVVQQGMNSQNSYARRYHWISDAVRSFVDEPHAAICCDAKGQQVLDMTAHSSEESRKTSLDIVNDNPSHIEGYLKISARPEQTSLYDFVNGDFPSQEPAILSLCKNHRLRLSKRSMNALKQAYEVQPESYEELTSLKGIGAGSIRALALISELVYGTEASWNDPAKFSFAHGGKDGIPYPVDKKRMDDNTALLKDAVRNARLGNKERLDALRRLALTTL